MPSDRFDAVIIGGGHNGLVAAAMLARAGRRVVVLERGEQVGGAAVSGTPFAGVGARLSRYSYLVSLFPAGLLRALGVDVTLRPRAVASYTPDGDSGALVGTGEASGRFERTLERVAERVFPTLTEPLPSRRQLRERIDDDDAWHALFQAPLSEALMRHYETDLRRGVILTDGLIGTFASAQDPSLKQNRCFLYHVIGNGTGRWDVPVGGMGAVTGALAACAQRAGARIETHADVVRVQTDERIAEVTCADGRRFAAEHAISGVAPHLLAALMNDPAPEPRPQGCQLKINMLLARLPSLRDRAVSAQDAFAGTFHVNEGYEQLELAYRQAAAGTIPRPVPCELYCHSLTDPSILSPELQAAGAHTLTLFALHLPASLFTDARAKAQAVAATLASVDSVLAEPLQDCLWCTPDGEVCLEAISPPELEAELGMPGGHIFHRDLQWPFAESEHEVGSWGVETHHANVWLCGAGARRGGGVSGIPGHNAARAVLAAAPARR